MDEVLEHYDPVHYEDGIVEVPLVQGGSFLVVNAPTAPAGDLELTPWRAHHAALRQPLVVVLSTGTQDLVCFELTTSKIELTEQAVRALYLAFAQQGATGWEIRHDGGRAEGGGADRGRGSGAGGPCAHHSAERHDSALPSLSGQAERP